MAVCGEGVEDLAGGFVPDEWLGVGVPLVDPAADVGFEFDHAAVGGAAQFAVGQLGEPASTRLSQEPLVGVKCRWNHGWRSSHCLILGVL